MDIVFSYYKNYDDESYQYRFHGNLDGLFNDCESSILLSIDEKTLHHKLSQNGFYIAIDDYTGSVQTVEIFNNKDKVE